MKGAFSDAGWLALLVLVAGGCARASSVGDVTDTATEEAPADTALMDVPLDDAVDLVREDPVWDTGTDAGDAVDVAAEEVSDASEVFDTSDPDIPLDDAVDHSGEDPVADTGAEPDATTDPSSTITLTAIADAFVCSDDWADANHGTETYSRRAVGRQNSYTGEQIGRQFYQFTAPSTLGGVAVASAELRLKMFDNFAGFPSDTAVYGLGDVWSETTVTWNTKPAEDSLVLDSISVSCCGIVYNYDVTTYVNTQLAAGDLTLSFSQRAPDETIIGGVRWFQREGHGVTVGTITGEAPQLVITP